MQCRIESSRAFGAHVIALAGVVDLAALPACRAALTAGVADTDAQLLVVDLDGTAVLDDAVFGLVIGAAARMRATRRSLVVVCSDRRLRELIAEVGVDRIVEVVDDLSDALAHHGGRWTRSGSSATS